MGDLSDFDRGQIVGVHLAGVCVTKTATLLGVLRVTVSKVVLVYMACKDNIRKKGTVGEN
jgi:hypothetical protein